MTAKHRHPTIASLPLVLALAIAALAIALAGPAGAAGSGRSARPSAVQIVRVNAHSFDWGDAGIGAAGIGISMLAVGATLLVTNSRQPQNPQCRLTANEQS